MNMKNNPSLKSTAIRSAGLSHQYQSPPKTMNMMMLSSLLLVLFPASTSALIQNPLLQHVRQFSSGSRIPCTTQSRYDRCTLFSSVGDEEEAHLQGISVGIDLGTTNSAVAMMVPSDGPDG